MSGFRERLLADQQEGLLFKQELEQLKAQGLLTGKAQQRTDSAYVLATEGEYAFIPAVTMTDTSQECG